MMELGLEILLRAGASLLGSSPSEAATNVADVLKQRLVQYHAITSTECPALDESLEDLQLRTAMEALYVLQRLQCEWSRDDAASRSQGGPSSAGIGSRDLTKVRTLLAIVFKWGVEPLLGRVVNAIPVKTPAKPQAHAGAKIIDLTGVPDDYDRLSGVVLRFLTLPFPDDPQGPLLQTAVTSTLLSKHLGDLLKPCIVLGWMPKNLATECIKSVDSVRPLVMRLLAR